MKLHPQYDPVSYANDVAVLELAEPLDADTVAGAVCLPRLPLEQYRQTGLKYTEHKTYCRHYLGVTHNTMSSAQKLFIHRLLIRHEFPPMWLVAEK